MLDDIKYIHERDGSDALGSAEHHFRPTLGDTVLDWSPLTPAQRNLAKQIALDIIGKSVVIYSGPDLHQASHSWKTDLNTLAHHVTWLGSTEADEAAGWQHPVDKLYTIIELSLESDREAKQHYEQQARQLSGVRPAPITVDVPARDSLIWAQALGHYVAIYVAILNGIKL